MGKGTARWESRWRTKRWHREHPKDPKIATVTNGDGEMVARRIFDTGYGKGQLWLDRFVAEYQNHAIEVTPL